MSSIVGATDVFVYPFGAAPTAASPTTHVLRDHGFTILCDIDTIARIEPVDGVVVMSRRHIDGIAFADQVRALAPFFDAGAVEDTTSRHVTTRTASR